jgi:RNA polymerase sigma factor (sigma-70 family)
MSNGAEPSDAELWGSSIAGDPEAFGKLFERHDRAVYNHAFRRTGDWSAAEDVMSLVFLEAWRRRESVQLTGESSLPWLLGVANYVLLNRWRSRRRHRAALARLPREHSEDFADDCDERIDVDRRFIRVIELLDKLPEGDRAVSSSSSGTDSTTSRRRRHWECPWARFDPVSPERGGGFLPLKTGKTAQTAWVKASSHTTTPLPTTKR